MPKIYCYRNLNVYQLKVFDKYENRKRDVSAYGFPYSDTSLFLLISMCYWQYTFLPFTTYTPLGRPFRQFVASTSWRTILPSTV